jgi:hypothetical protein
MEPVALFKCRCGTLRGPESFRPVGLKSHRHVLRCPTCGFKGGPGYTDEGVRKAWNEAVQASVIRRPMHGR